VAYILLLFYWFVWVSGGGLFQNFRYTQILGELMRSGNAEGGERDDFGRHWTINIAEFFINNALNELLDYFFPTWIWSRTVFHVVLTLFIFGHCVVQLFLQKQITRLMRLNRSIFKWRDYGLEYCCHAVIRQLDTRMMRVLVHMWWWTWHQVYQILTPEVTNSLTFRLAGLNMSCRIFFSRSAVSVWISRAIRWLLLYRLLLWELAKFSNPDPPMYQYSNLEESNHIRLILLHPRFGFRPISCSLLKGSHMGLLCYEAVSYT
jgi:hypothetical protein